jgi:hypothetical protein
MQYPVPAKIKTNIISLLMERHNLTTKEIKDVIPSFASRALYELSKEGVISFDHNSKVWNLKFVRESL